MDEGKVVKAILHYQQNLERYIDRRDEAKMIYCMEKLQRLPITVSHLEQTGVGRTVNSVRKIKGMKGSPKNAARQLVGKWKQMVTEEDDDDCDDEEDKESDDDDDDDDEDEEGHVSEQDEDSDHGQDDSDDRLEIYCGDDNDDEEETRNIGMRHSSHRNRDYSSEHDRNYCDEETRETRVVKHTSHSRHQDEDDEDFYNTNILEHDHDSLNSFMNNSQVNEGKEERNDSVLSRQDDERHKKHKKTRETSVEKQISKDKSRDTSNDREKENNDVHNQKRNGHHKSRRSGEKSDKHKDKHSRHKQSTSSNSQRGSSKENSLSSSKDKDINSSSKEKEKEKENKDNSSNSSGYGSGKDRDKEKNKKSSSLSSPANKSSSSSVPTRSNESDKVREKSSSSKKRRSEDVTTKSPSSKKVKVSVEDGIDCESGASFAEALGMINPGRSSTSGSGSKKEKEKKDATRARVDRDKEKQQTYDRNERSRKSHTRKEKHKDCEQRSGGKEKEREHKPLALAVGKLVDAAPAALLQALPSNSNSKLEDGNIVTNMLPQISTNYKPLGHLPGEAFNRNKVINDDEALTRLMYMKTQRTKVYSGNKVFYGKVPSLFDSCIRVLQDNIDSLEYTGGVPYSILKPVLERMNVHQLFALENHNPYIIEDTNGLWQLHCQRDFKTKRRDEMETWRDMYLRCQDEREAKLKSLTANIKLSQDKSVPVRQTKLAYVDSVVKPPRNIAKRQAKNGIVPHSRPAVTPSSRLTQLALAGGADKVLVPNPGAHRVNSGGGGGGGGTSSGNNFAVKPKKAPLMAKTLQLMKGRFRR